MKRLGAEVAVLLIHPFITLDNYLRNPCCTCPLPVMSTPSLLLLHAQVIMGLSRGRYPGSLPCGGVGLLCGGEKQ